MALRKRIGRVTRQVDVPLCADCWRKINRESGEEERLGKMGWLAAGGTAVLALTVIFLLTPAEMSLSLRLLVGLALALVLAEFARQLFRRAQRKAMLPVKKAIRQSANLTNFSWRAAVFEFTNETFAERFKEINESLLMKA
ncbi:MAG: hypothetical protein GY803_32970 [Chloroflexi bacterium]|nr:hypothetical protein [Chloroflexota bacterium]